MRREDQDPAVEALQHEHVLVAAARDQAARIRSRIAAAAVDGGSGPADDDGPTGIAQDRLAHLQGQLPGYELEREIHRGGQGVVYQALQRSTGRQVAIKVMKEGPFAGADDKARFDREVRILAQLDHPSIVAIHDSGIAGGCYYFVMNYVAGAPLDVFIRDSEPTLEETLGLFVKISNAVNAAHLRGIVHRDLKPSNIRIDADGEPHVLDFGLAKVEEGSRSPDETVITAMTLTGQFVGSLPWASPEQAAGVAGGIDVRSDVYSLGVVLYQMLTGTFPYDVGGAMLQVVQRIVHAEPVRPSVAIGRSTGRRFRMNDDVETIVLKCLSKDHERRYQNAGELARDLRHYLAGEPIEARRESTWYVLRKTAAKHRVVVAGAALIIVILAAFGAAMARQAHRLDIRGRELAGALRASNVEWGRSVAAAGNIPLAEDTVFPELIRAGVTRIDGPEVGFTGSPEALHAYWALWDVFRNSRCVATLRNLVESVPERISGKEAILSPPNFVRLLYFDKGGQRLNALDSHGRLVSWSVATWESVRDKSLFVVDEGLNYRASVAPNGSIGVFGPKGMIRVIDPETGQVEAQAEDPDDQALTGSVSPDGTLIATAGRAKRLRVRDARSPSTVIMTVDGVGWNADEPNQWGGPRFSPDGGLVAAARPDGSLGLWDTKSGVLDRSLRPPASVADRLRYFSTMPFGKLAFAPDGTIASQYGLNLVVWPGDGSAPRDLGEPGGAIETVAFLPGSDGCMVVASGDVPAGGGLTTVWDLASGNRRATFKHPDGAGALAISPDARLLVVGMISGMVQVYEATPEPHVTALQGGRLWPYSNMALSPDGRRLAITTREDPPLEQDILLIDIKSRATISRFRRTGPEVKAFEFAPDGLALFEFDESGRVRLWDLGTDSCTREFVFPEPHRTEPEPAGGTNQLRVSSDGRMLARAREDGLIGLWDVPSGLWIGLLDGSTNGSAVIDFSPDGHTLVAQHLEAVVLWDVQTRRVKRTIAIDKWVSVNGVRFSPDGRLLTRNASGRLQFCDADTGRVLSECSPDSAGMGMAFHPNGTVFFATAWDRSIRLWDTRTGRELLSLQKHNQYMRGLLLTPDGNTLITSDWAGTVLVWDLTYYNDRIRRELEYRASHSEDQ